MSEPETRTITRKDWLLIGVLIALVLPLRLWLLYNTEVTARDSIGYIGYAFEFERTPLGDWAEDVLKKKHQHPGYPLLVLLVSVPVRAIDGQTTPENMELTTQLISLVASLLLCVAMYHLGRQFFDRRISFVAALVYQYLPVSAQHLSDGISEPVFLALLVAGLLQAVHAVRSRSAWRGALAGLCTGLAYLIRPEGALILPAFGLTLCGLQLRSAWRAPWGRFLACGTAMALTTALVGSTYVIAIGKLTNKPTALEMTARADAAQGGPLFAASIAPSDSTAIRLQRGVVAILSEIGQGFHYAAVVPALLGLWWCVGTLRRDAGFWMLAAFGMIHAAVLIRLAMSVYYVSDRHVMILVIFGCAFLAAGLLEVPRRALALWRKPEDLQAWRRTTAAWSTVLVLALLASCMPKATQRLHGNREGNHAAGLWLAEHLQWGDHVEDDHAWSVYFSGFLFREGETPILPADQKPTTYVVATSSRDSELNGRRHSENIAPNARRVYQWPEQAEPQRARVVIYAQPRDPAKNPWHKAPAR